MAKLDGDVKGEYERLADDECEGSLANTTENGERIESGTDGVCERVAIQEVGDRERG